MKQEKQKTKILNLGHSFSCVYKCLLQSCFFIKRMISIKMVTFICIKYRTRNQSFCFTVFKIITCLEAYSPDHLVLLQNFQYVSVLNIKYHLSSLIVTFLNENRIS